MLTIAARPGRRVLCVTSGGVIGMMVRHILDLDPGRMAHLLVPIRNASIHRVAVLSARHDPGGLQRHAASRHT
jgi:broad specificity phosphatase PhoE